MEIRRHWPVVCTGALGLTAGMAATMAYSLGSFIPPLQEEFGWGRADISLAFTALTIGIFLSAPVAGRLCDRYGAALVGMVSLCVYGLITLAMASLISSLEMFWLAYLAMAIVGAGTTPAVMVRPVTMLFDRSRGLALGLTLTGAGIAGFWVPQLVTAIVELAGWRDAYRALGLIALAAAPLVWIGFNRISSRKDDDLVLAAPVQDGLDVHEARRTPHFWLLTAMALLMSTGMTGVVIHCVPLLRDHGVDPAAAAQIAGMIGLAGVAGRIAVGGLLDRLPATLVAVAIFGLAAIGILMLRGGLAPAIAAIAIGLAYGAEIDLLAYLSARYFGLASFSSIYGWQYSIFAVGSGLSPWWIGKLYELDGTYGAPLLLCACLAGSAAALALRIGTLGPVGRGSLTKHA